MLKQFVQLTVMLVFLTLGGCESAEESPVAEVVLPTITSSPLPSETAVPPTETSTVTAVPTDTPVPTSTVTATATFQPSATATDTPTETPAPTETAVPTNTAAPVNTNTPAPVTPTSPASLPAIGAPPAGPNLLVNPGFEYGLEGWRRTDIPNRIFTTDVYPQFVHSGTSAVRNYAEQLVENLQPGTTYRAGAWLKVWASDGENREISDNPGDYFGRICISDEGTNPPTLYCSGSFRPIDTWQYITVDAIPTSNRVVVKLTTQIGANHSAHYEIMWDDAEFGVSPVAATATPSPLGRPVPPAPVPFNATAVRDNMNSARTTLEQMGGLLDRLYRGSQETCSEYDDYYRSLVGSPRYDGVPAEWQNVYNEYIFAVENGSSSNQPIFELCYEHGGGGVTELNYGAAREGVNTSLNRLIPAIDTANALLNQ